MIDVRNLVKNHGELRVLDGVSLSVRRGEVASVIGPSGGGKSTLLRCINGLEMFQDGEVQVDEVRLRPGTPHREMADTLRTLRRRVGMVFQQFHLFPHMSVLDNVLAGPLYVLNRKREEADPEARQLLARVGLAEKLAAMPEQLSGGQQQRVAIARALAMKPEAILFDEPTSALDPRIVGGGDQRHHRPGEKRSDDDRRHARDGLCPQRFTHGARDARRPRGRVGTASADFRQPARGSNAAVPRPDKGELTS